VCLDTAVSKLIFGNKRLLTNVHETEPITFIGFKGSLISNLVGNFQGIMDCYYSKEASANILSYSELESNRKINITSRNNKFRVRCNGLDHLFEHEDGFYVKSFPEVEEVKEKPDQAVAFIISVASTPPGTTIYSVEEAAALAVTVREMEDQYPPVDVKQAKIAQEFRRRLGVPAKASIVKLLLHNGSGNVVFQPKHLDIADSNYGKRLAALAGKSVEPRNLLPPPSTIYIVPKERQVVLGQDTVPIFGRQTNRFEFEYASR
jgi:hypothetical protein